MAGGIPLIRPLRESLAGDRITRVLGIVNGTTNYILTRMTEDGPDLRRRAGRGAEPRATPSATPPPTSRATTPRPRPRSSPAIAFGARVVAGDVYREGISGVTADDIAIAGRLGYVVKLLAIDRATIDGEVAVRVHPAMVPATTRWRRCASRSTPCSSRATPPAS